jgi:hypothetical protein
MRGQPFEPGNTIGKGRPRGSRNKRTVFQEALESHGLQAISQLKLLAFRPNPDMTALRLYVERLVAIPKPEQSVPATACANSGRFARGAFCTNPSSVARSAKRPGG